MTDLQDYGKTPEAMTIPLSGGRISLEVFEALWPLEDLCAFAARNNSKRGFLIVSKVLGRHMPARPSVMEAAAETLAAQMIARAGDLPGPVLFVGLAETAVCLGHSVHDRFVALTGRDDTLSLHTTRQKLDAEVIARFSEPHSHAAKHLIYAPALARHRELLRSARSLILIDDEVSTGVTIVNLAHALSPHLPGLERICTSALADWSNTGDYASKMPVPAVQAALLHGAISWLADEQADPIISSMAPVDALGTMDAHVNFGRLGVQGRPPGVASSLQALPRRAEDRFLILGTGEFTWPPFLLAQALEREGHDVVMQATSRSPIRLGGAIESALTFRDNYGTGVPNYLYNVGSDVGRRVILCHETPVGSIDPDLVQALNAECLCFRTD